MSFKTPLLCDRRTYDKRGEWKSPNNDIAENVFYFVKEPLTLVPKYDRYGREEMTPTTTIVVFGGKPIVKEDEITLETGEKFRVSSITINYAEHNILVKDLLKPRIESMELVLE
jgi:hypothetical protein